MKLFIILIYFLKEEIKINLRRIKKIYMFFKTFSFFRLLLYLINNSFVPSRDKNFRNYILKNSKKWKNKNSLKNSDNKKVLITNVYDHVVYTTTEIVIGKNLMEMFNADGIALLNEYNLKQILLFKSFGINKIIILRNFNIFVRFRYFIKAYLIIKSCKNMDEFLNFNINNVEIGKIVYDNYLRFSGMGSTNEFNSKFYENLSKSLLIYYQIDKHFKKYKIIASVQSEKQFLPGGILFQTALINGVNVYSRNEANYNTKILAKGRNNNGYSISVRKYTNINERYKHKYLYSNKLLDLINKNINLREEAIRIGENSIKKRFEGLPEYQIRVNEQGLRAKHPRPEFQEGNKNRKIEKKDITKEDLCKRLGWSSNSSIAVIFATDLTDGVFDASWSLFRDRLIWLRETLIEIKKINNINWLVKPHPNDERLKVITTVASEYEKSCSNCNHIKLFPDDISSRSLPKFIDAVITLNGSAATEYPCFGIPAIIGCEASCSGLGHAIEPRSKEEYFFQLQNIKKLKKLNSQQIEAAKIYIFVLTEFTQVPANLISKCGFMSGNFDEKVYWAKMIKLLDQYNYEENWLLKMMKIQETNNDTHTIDYRWFEKRKLGDTTFDRHKETKMTTIMKADTQSKSSA